MNRRADHAELHISFTVNLAKEELSRTGKIHPTDERAINRFGYEILYRLLMAAGKSFRHIIRNFISIRLVYKIYYTCTCPV